MLKRIIKHYRHNPEGYWFKRKLHGWLVVVAAVALLLLGVIFFVLVKNAMMPSGDTVSARCSQESAPYLNPGLSVSTKMPSRDLPSLLASLLMRSSSLS